MTPSKDAPSNLTISSFRRSYLRFRHLIREFVGLHPIPYFFITRLRDIATEALVGPETEVVIEGYPRSGNSFAVTAFRLAQGRDVRIAHHHHAPAQVKYAAKYRIPSIVVIREPIEAVISLHLLSPYLTLSQMLRDYIRYYLEITPFRDSVVVASFHQLTTDFGAIIHQLNKRYSTRFIVFDHSESNVSKCFELMEADDRKFWKSSSLNVKSRSIPSPEKQQDKERLRMNLLTPSLRGLVAHAQTVYTDFLKYL